MKLNKSILTAALGLSVAGAAQAGEIYLTGSTAMRSTVYATLIAPNTVFNGTPAFTGYGGKGSGDNYMAFVGTLKGGSGTTTINCTWSGSEDGIQHVVQNTTLQQTFMADSLIQSSGFTDNSASTPPSTQNAFCQLAMADNAQAFSRTRSPVLNHGAEVGVITFEWVRNKGLWTGSNVSDFQIQQALNGGAVRAVFDGNPADVNDFVYVSGRDSGSGTRVNALGNCGFGILTPVQQIEMDGSGNMLLVGGQYIGDFGFSSGGTLAGTMGNDTTAKTDQVNSLTGYSVIAYLGVGDADAAVTAGGTVLTYDGVAFSPSAVTEGNYSFWGNEYIFEANNVSTGSEADQAFTLVKNNIASFCDGRKAIALSSMNCSRPGPQSVSSHF